MSWIKNLIFQKLFGQGLDGAMAWVKKALNGLGGSGLGSAVGFLIMSLSWGLIQLLPLLLGSVCGANIVCGFLVEHQAQMLEVLTYAQQAGAALMTAGIARRALNA